MFSFELSSSESEIDIQTQKIESVEGDYQLEHVFQDHLSFGLKSNVKRLNNCSLNVFFVPSVKESESTEAPVPTENINKSDQPEVDKKVDPSTKPTSTPSNEPQSETPPSPKDDQPEVDKKGDPSTKPTSTPSPEPHSETPPSLKDDQPVPSDDTTTPKEQVSEKDDSQQVLSSESETEKEKDLEDVAVPKESDTGKEVSVDDENVCAEKKDEEKEAQKIPSEDTPVPEENNTEKEVVSVEENNEKKEQKVPEENKVEKEPTITKKDEDTQKTPTPETKDTKEDLTTKPTPLETKDSDLFISLNTEHQFFIYNLTQNRELTYTIEFKSKSAPFTQVHNPYTLNEYIIGFSRGEILYVFGEDQNVFNVKGRINRSSITSVKWVDENRFVVAFINGQIYYYDKRYDHEVVLFNKKMMHKHYIVKVNEESEVNPLVMINCGDKQIFDVSVSNNKKRLAVASDFIRVIEFENEYKLKLLFQSFYATFTCCSWSKDDRFIVAGGQDDLISLFDVENEILVCRCVGHQSFIRKVYFDYYYNVDKNDKFRLVSIADDSNLILWDLENIDTLVKECKEEEKIIEFQKKENEDHVKEVVSVKNDTKTVQDIAERNSIKIILSKKMNEVCYFKPTVVYKKFKFPVRDICITEFGIVTLTNGYVIHFFSRPGQSISKKISNRVSEKKYDKKSKLEKEDPKKESRKKGFLSNVLSLII